jgi:sec-independent protein translocase protein TatB
MFGIGMPELILILAVALVVIGPKKLPDLAKSLGKAMGEFKKATNEIKDSMQLDNGIKEVKTSFEDLEKELKKPVEGAPSATSTDTPTPDPEQSASAEGDRETAAEIKEIPAKAANEVSDAEPSEAELEEFASEATPPDSNSADEEPTPEDHPRKADT